MNEEISHSDDGLWKVKTEYIVKEIAIITSFVFLTTMFKLLVILFIIKLYARAIIIFWLSGDCKLLLHLKV